MSETATVEQVMERIRAQVRQKQGDRPFISAAATEQEPRQSEARAPHQAAAPTLPEDFSRLHSEVSAALQGHLNTGQLNPRLPGLHNDALQFVKKVMRRSLTWYTRPLHLFQASVIRALQHVDTILHNLNSAIQHQSAALRQTAQQIQPLRSELSLLHEKQNELEQKLRGQLQSEVDKSSIKIAQQASQLDILHAQLAGVQEQLRQSAELRQTAELRLRGQLQSEVDKSSIKIAQQASQLDILGTQLAAVQEQLLQSAVATRGRERDSRRLRQALEGGNFAPLQPAAGTPPMFPSELQHEAEFDYFLFEEQYRGGEADIRERQNAYLDFFRGRDNVIDIGCGRGEFLELLRDNNIGARGVELGTDQYLLCREKGLDVIQQDLFTFLESQPDASLGGLFSAQVIEHMAASDQLRFVSLAYQKCSSQSAVVFETINPECIYALVHNFFLDPTHVRPAHPCTLKFAMESCGFRNVQLRFSSPVSDKSIPRLALNGASETLRRFDAAMAQVNELLYGCQDYAAIGWK